MKVMGLMIFALAVWFATPCFGQDIPTLERVWGSLGTGPGQFGRVQGIAVAPDGNIYTVDADLCRVSIFTPSGVFVRSYGSCGTGVGQLRIPKDIAISPLGRVYVADYNNGRISVFAADDSPLSPMPLPPAASGVTSLAFSPDGQYLYALLGSGEVQTYDTLGVMLGKWSARGAGSIGGICVSPNGTVYVPSGGCGIKGYSSNQIGLILSSWNDNLRCPGQFGVAVEGDSVVLATNGDSVLKYSSSGSFEAAWSTYGADPAPTSSGPFDIAVSLLDRSIYVIDSTYGRILKFAYGATPVHRSTWGGLKLRYR